MGKFDRRNSQKMKRRKGQAKKKARLARLRAVTKPASGVSGATKKVAPKKAKPAVAAS